MQENVKNSSKTIVCKFYKIGTCTKGSKCPYSHAEDSVAVCAFYLNGDCRFGAYCKLPHIKPKKEKKPIAAPVKSSVKPILSSSIIRESEELRSDIVLPSVLDELLTPTELLQVSNSRDEVTKTKSKPFSYSSIAKVGVTPTSEPSNLVHNITNELSNSKTELIELSDYIDDIPLEERQPLCPFASQGNCRFGSTCRYIHGKSCPVCLKNVLHPHGSREEHIRHITECQSKKLKVLQLQNSTVDAESKECVVCMEIVASKKDPRFGIMNCEHCVCLECIRTWRANDKMDTSRSCPICRTITYFVTPSAVWPVDLETKASIIGEYKNKLSAIDCRHYNFGDSTCPFGISCFYRHVDKIGNQEDYRLRMMKGDDDEVKIIGVLKLSDYLEKYDNQVIS